MIDLTLVYAGIELYGFRRFSCIEFPTKTFAFAYFETHRSMQHLSPVTSSPSAYWWSKHFSLHEKRSRLNVEAWARNCTSARAIFWGSIVAFAYCAVPPKKKDIWDYQQRWRWLVNPPYYLLNTFSVTFLRCWSRLISTPFCTTTSHNNESTLDKRWWSFGRRNVSIY